MLRLDPQVHFKDHHCAAPPHCLHSSAPPWFPSPTPDTDGRVAVLNGAIHARHLQIYLVYRAGTHTHTLEHSQKPRSIHCGTEQQETGLSSHEDSINIWQNINAPGVSDAQYLSTRLSAPALSENLFSREQFLPHAIVRKQEYVIRFVQMLLSVATCQIFSHLQE